MERLSLKRLSAVGMWGGLLFGDPERYVRAPFFLEPEDIKNVSLGAFWNFGKVTGLPSIKMGHKGAVN
jgi:hypothetical protein